MEKNIRELLEEKIVQEIQFISEDLEAKDKSATINNVAKLYELRLNDIKLEEESKEKEFRRDLAEKEYNSDIKMKEHQRVEDMMNREVTETNNKDTLKEMENDRKFKLYIEAAGLIIPIIFYSALYAKGLKFEETGTFTSSTFKGLIQKIKPFK